CCESAFVPFDHFADFFTRAVTGLHNVILYCNYYYYKDAAELMNIRISGASEQNGDAAREVNRACNVKN
ncbi:MAG: hypothetical protein SPJ45_08240, partial [Anaerovoracaceae bacterium]|nr:hypothetical protein [Anaerovoracaceae bacterium]